MTETPPAHDAPAGGNPWQRLPLYIRILIALILGAVVGLILHANGQVKSPETAATIKLPATLILRLLQALATPLVLFAILNAFVTTEIKGAEGRRLAVLLVTNTVAAILIGLLITNIVQPGRFFHNLGDAIGHAPGTVIHQPSRDEIVDTVVPRSVLEPIVTNQVLQLLWVALAFGIAFRQFKNGQIAENKSDYLGIEKAIGILLSLLMQILMWVITIIPLAVFCVVTSIVGQQGLGALSSLGAFIGTVLLALAGQMAFYLLRIRLQGRTSPLRVLRSMGDALTTAFSTSSSTATMPITFRCLIENVGLRPKSASLGALVGSNFNNDGTALYEATAALFMAQALGLHLDIGRQVIVVLTSILASVGAAGIPEAGLVTMTLVFKAVSLPTSAIALLISVDWFLDRCRTAMNVMGDVTVATLLDAQGTASDAAAPEEQGTRLVAAPLED